MLQIFQSTLTISNDISDSANRKSAINNSGETIIIIRKKNGEVETYSGRADTSSQGEIDAVLSRINSGRTTSTTTTTTSTTEAPAVTTSGSVTLIDPGLDARTEIANYNAFMDQIYARMNAAIKKKKLDPMDLKLLPNLGKKGGSTLTK